MKPSINSNEYEPRTLPPSALISRGRRYLLPAYPAHKFDTRPPLLLLANVHTVDRNLMEVLSYSGENSDGNLQYYPFQFSIGSDHEFLSSFMINFYRKLFLDTSRRWKIPLSMIDYNLTRLHNCMDKYGRQTDEAAIGFIDELPLALEFYLQIDGNFCIDELLVVIDIKLNFSGSILFEDM